MSVTVTSLGGTVGIQGRLPSASAAGGEADKSMLVREREGVREKQGGRKEGREGQKRGLLSDKQWAKSDCTESAYTRQERALPSEAKGKWRITAGYNGKRKD